MGFMNQFITREHHLVCAMVETLYVGYGHPSHNPYIGYIYIYVCMIYPSIDKQCLGCVPLLVSAALQQTFNSLNCGLSGFPTFVHKTRVQAESPAAPQLLLLNSAAHVLCLHCGPKWKTTILQPLMNPGREPCLIMVDVSCGNFASTSMYHRLQRTLCWLQQALPHNYVPSWFSQVARNLLNP